MTISSKQVMDLRAATGMPMMKCKKALEVEGGDFEKAVDRLRKEGLKAADVRAHKGTSQGTIRVHLSEAKDRGLLLALACETEPVSHTPLFTAFADRLLAQVARTAPADAEVLLAQPWIDDPAHTVEEELAALKARIGENMRIQEVARLDVEGSGIVACYIHHTGKDAALVALSAPRPTGDLDLFARNLCMHIVFAKPIALTRDEIPEEVRAKEREIARAQVEQDPKMARKPAGVIEKVVEGKLQAFYKQTVLGEQEWVVDPGAAGQSVADLLRGHGASAQAFRRVHLGG